MPTYDYECQAKCGIFEAFHSMHERLKKCPTCGAKVEKCVVVGASHTFKDAHWEDLNGGRGMYIGGLGTRKDPKAYCRSLNEAKDKAKAAGKSYEIG